ncbi:MAG: TRAP transporter small permease [Marinilabiliales bacterium]|nr:MAG: TRAP transporter small permease [Marinilabiliales bacterium]
MTIRKHLDRALATFVTILMGVLVLNVLWQVASRYLVGHPSAFTDELAGFLLIWVGLLGATYITGKKEHLAIDLLHHRLSPEKKAKVNISINLLIALFALAVLVVGGTNLVYITLRLSQVSSALQIPVGYVYLVLPLSGLFIIYYSVYDIVYPQTDEQEQVPGPGQVPEQERPTL